MTLLEIGNSTIKVVGIVDGAPTRAERFDSAETLLRRLDTAAGPIIVAPVGRRFSDVLLDHLRSDERVSVLDGSLFAAFIAGSYDTPDTLGLDRILNLYALERDGIVISCGTAITVDAVVDGRPVWGAILPGFRTAATGLHDRIPLLPLVGPEDPPRVPARTSVDSVANGVLLATALGALELARRLEPAPDDPIVTGGDAELFADLCRPRQVSVDPMLLMRGMLRAYRLVM